MGAARRGVSTWYTVSIAGLLGCAAGAGDFVIAARARAFFRRSGAPFLGPLPRRAGSLGMFWERPHGLKGREMYLISHHEAYLCYYQVTASTYCWSPCHHRRLAKTWRQHLTLDLIPEFLPRALDAPSTLLADRIHRHADLGLIEASKRHRTTLAMPAMQTCRDPPRSSRGLVHRRRAPPRWPHP